MKRSIYRMAMMVVVLSFLVTALAVAGVPPTGADLKPREIRTDLPDGASNDWWETVTEQILADEYNLTRAADSLHNSLGEIFRAPNRAHGIETLFTAEGIRITPAVERGQTWSWECGLMGIGQETVHSLPLIGRNAAGNRIDYNRWFAQEWYRNSERGVQQGFDIPVRPAGESETLHLDVALSTSLRAAISEDGRVIDFYTNDGAVAVLRYSLMMVTDAAGMEVPARFEGTDGGIRITVDDSAASYPITINSLTTTPAWSATGEGINNYFGYSVSTAGDVNGDGYADVLVGALRYNSYTGKAYLYLGGPTGLSTTPAWSATGEGINNYFGWSVSTAGDVNGDGYADVLIGAYVDNSNMGKAYLYYGGPTGLSASPAWTATGEGTDNYFGCSVSTAGDVNGDGYTDVLVGASNYNIGTGKAYLYLGGPTGLSATPGWSATGEGPDNYFCSVSTAGDVNGDGYADVLVGAYGYNSNTGKAYLYHGGPTGLSASPAWTATGEEMYCDFGRSVSTAGDVNGDGYADVLVGASNYNIGRGKAYLYHGGPTGLSATPAWSGAGVGAEDSFGWSVSTAGDVNDDGYADILVGASNYNIGTGKAYLYLGGPSGLSATPGWSATGEGPDNYFCSVSTAGDVNGDGYADVLVGAYGYNSFAGKAYVYLGGPSGLSAISAWNVTGEGTNDSFGWSVSTAGDVNGDGYADVLVGACGYSTNTGKVYLYPGGPTGPSATSAWSLTGEEAGNFFGQSISPAGDVNGDGYADVLVGAYVYNSYSGKAYLYLGGPSGLSSIPAWSATGEEASNYFGWSVSTAGDVNGDGYADILVGADGYGSNTGKVYLYLGGPSFVSATPAWTATGEGAGNRFGRSVSTAGDVNGDGYTDVIVGAYAYSSYSGKAYLYLGGPSGLSASPAWSATGQETYYNFGYAVSTAGDVNGDGYADVIVGAYAYNINTGKAYLYLGGPSGLSATSAWSATGEGTGNFFGYAVSTARDVNSDGYADIFVGAYGNSSYTGKVYLYLGGPSGPTASPAWTATGEETNNYFGRSVSTAGDVNGDGYADALVGAYGYSSSTGKTYFYFGGGGAGVPLLPGQMRADMTAPIAPLGLALEQQFRLGLILRTPFGRGRVKLEWQAVPLGESFNPIWNPIQSWDLWLDTHLSGVGATELVALTPLVGPYKWRARARYHPVTSPYQSFSRWITMADNSLHEADLRSVVQVACVPPDEPVWIYQVDKVGDDYTLNFQDPNQANQRTGWNVRRANDASLPMGNWLVVASNVVDMDQATPNYQWTDTSGDDPGVGLVWYYQVTAYNSYCPAEGPF